MDVFGGYSGGCGWEEWGQRFVGNGKTPVQTTHPLRPCVPAGKTPASPHATSRGGPPAETLGRREAQQSTDPLRPCVPAGNNPPPHRAPPSRGGLPQRRWDAGKPNKPRILCASASLREIIPRLTACHLLEGASRRDAGTQGNPTNHGSAAPLRPCGKYSPRLTACHLLEGASRRDAGTQGNPTNHGSAAPLRPCGK